MDEKYKAPADGVEPWQRERAWCLCRTPIGTVRITGSGEGVTGVRFWGGT